MSVISLVLVAGPAGARYSAGARGLRGRTLGGLRVPAGAVVLPGFMVYIFHKLLYRVLSMTALRSTARHVLRGLAIVAPACIHQRNAREAARRAHPTMTQAQSPNPYLPQNLR